MTGYNKNYYASNKEKFKSYSQAYYEANREAITERARRNYHANKERDGEKRQLYRDANKAAMREKCLKSRQFLQSVKINMGCQNPDCQWKDEFKGCDLDFHHIDPTIKECDVSILVRRSREKIVMEIGKCTVLCAICHRRATNGLLDCSNFVCCKLSETPKKI